MSNETFEGGLIWSPLFNASEREIEDFIQKLKSNTLFLNGFPLKIFVTDILGYTHDQSEDEDFLQATQFAIFNIAIMHTTFAHDVLTEEDYKKAQSTYKRDQLNSGALKELLDCFLKACRFFFKHDESCDLRALLWCDIKEKTELIKSNRLEKSFGPLKRIIEEIASGVKADCFFDAVNSLAHCSSLKAELNEYLINKYSYDFNKNTLYASCSFNGEENKLLQLALYENESFWEDKCFFIVEFVNCVFKKNSKKHAEKILDYIFSKLTSHPRTKALIDNNLSLSLYNSKPFVDYFSTQFKKLGYSMDLLYPLVPVENEKEKCKKGEEIFNSFLYKYVYPDSKEQIQRMLKEELQTKNGKIPLSLFEAIDFCVIKMNIFGDYGNALKIICPNFYLEESLWKRVYLKAYEASLNLKESNLNSHLFDSFYDMFFIIESNFGIETSAQLDTYARECAFIELKAILSDFGVSISDSKKADYINALLDRTISRSLETERFPVLEQLGDSIYGFAVAEMLFYMPVYVGNEESTDNLTQKFEKYVCASGQLKVAKDTGISKLYISPSYVFATRDNVNNCDEEKEEQQKCIADSLEMILGAVSLDLGYNVAISLAKAMVKKSYKSDFKEELHFSYENLTKTNIDRDYWRRILPGLYSDGSSPYDRSVHAYTNLMNEAFFKLLGCIVLKTESKDEREFLTYGAFAISRIFNSDNDKDMHSRVCPAFHCYLHNGLDKALELYKDRALEEYNKIKNKNKI